MKNFFLAKTPYPGEVLVSTSDDHRSLVNFLMRRYPKRYDREWILDFLQRSSEQACASTYTFKSGVIVVRFYEKRPSATTIMHEAMHAAFSLLKFAGVAIEADEEVFTYLTEFIVSEIHKGLRTKKCQSTHTTARSTEDSRQSAKSPKTTTGKSARSAERNLRRA